jgi:hypothetical protein
LPNGSLIGAATEPWQAWPRVDGDYPKDSPPKNWIKAVIPLAAIMTGSAGQLQKQAPTRETAIDLVRKLEADGEAYHANDMLYAFESSADDPAPKLSAIIKPMLTINFADDLINPPELLHLPTASNYTPAGPASYGHMTLAHPAVWASALGSSCSASRTSADERSDRPSAKASAVASILVDCMGFNPIGLRAAVEIWPVWCVRN